ncbi:formate/nitrite transporter family protein [Niallia sp. XMNu-256]|uniref:formate/nitrite transporter family protein n=1 Tax=Niallia sp. XMNu-256 TaxID=3082444 RepID=UPI0030D46BD2
MAFHNPQRIARLVVDAGANKAVMSVPNTLVLGFLAGAFISLGFLLNIRVVANLPSEWGSFTSLLGGAVFPLGVILVVLAGGELLTGNMLALTMATLARRATLGQLSRNWLLVVVSNFVGALFVAYFFGHIVGLTGTGVFLTETVATAQEKVDHSFTQALISGIGCNWLVCLAIWMAYGADDISGKILAIWFPIMGFVTIGFQNVVANMFVIPAAIFAGHMSWVDYFSNFVPVLIGNAIGGSLFVAFMYGFVYRKEIRLVESHVNKVKSKVVDFKI